MDSGALVVSLRLQRCWGAVWVSGYIPGLFPKGNLLQSQLRTSNNKPSPNHHFYGCYKPSKMGGLWRYYTHINSDQWFCLHLEDPAELDRHRRCYSGSLVDLPWLAIAQFSRFLYHGRRNASGKYMEIHRNLWKYDIWWSLNPVSVVQQTHETWEKKCWAVAEACCWAWLTACAWQVGWL